jgi:phage terminase large subunit-like protein
MPWDLSCPDWERRLREGRPLVPDLPLDEEAADRAVAVFNLLRLADVEDNPTMGEAAGDWFRAIVRAVFGSLDAATGQRMVRELLLLVPKKNSKTSNGALFMLTALLLNKRPRAKFIMTGPTQDVAELAFEQAKGAVQLDPVLKAKLHIRDHLKVIVHRVSGAELEIMTFDPAVLTGQKPAGVLVDELHVSAKMGKAASAIRQLRGGMLAVPEAFLAFITTQSEEPPAGPFRAELQKARAIRDGRQAGVMLPVLYEFPERMQKISAEWRDPANWPMVTPNAGRSISMARLVEEFATAESTGPEELRGWASQHLNVEIGLALHTDRWPGAEHWEACGRPGLTLEAMLARCDRIVAGVDGGGLDDLFGLALLGRERGTSRWLLWNRAWAHRIVLERRKSEGPRLLDFAASGDLVLHDGQNADVLDAVGVIKRVFDAGLLCGVGLDPVGIAEVLSELARQEITGEVDSAQGKMPLVQGIRQGWPMSGAIKDLERKLNDGAVEHGAQPLMAWCVGNAKAEQKGNAIAITKQLAGVGKIDPLIAAFMAAQILARDPEPIGFSYTGI